MNDYDPTSPHEKARRTRVRQVLPNTRSGRIGAAALMCAVIGLSAGCGTSSSASATSSPAPAASPSASAASPPAKAGHGMGGGMGGGSNARSGPATGGATGTVDSMSTSSFALATSAGQKLTVKEASSTTYKKGTSSASASAVTKGESVLVVGTVDGMTITATQVTVQPAGTGGSADSSAAGVVPFKRGAPSAAKKVGQVPANYTEGEGTIVSGTTANKATAAALAAYPGGVVDRVVKLSNGEFEVHNIGVNWPHHIFVSPDFKVLGVE